MHIGFIGGIGPSATISFYRRLIDEFKTADVPRERTIELADMDAWAQPRINQVENNKSALIKQLTTLERLQGPFGL